MSSRTIELFRQHSEKQRQEEPTHNSQAQQRREERDKPSLVAEMSRIEHEVRQRFDDASPAERDNIIRFFELLIRNLKRKRDNE
jgi:hypothetical protein